MTEAPNLKCYVLIISTQFPAHHTRKGQFTGFIKGIENKTKIHTVRENFDGWHRKIANVNEGKAYISCRIWTGKPRRSPQKEILRVYKAGVECFRVAANQMYVNEKPVGNELCYNDGLSPQDFREWFASSFPQSKPAAIIHFSDFRYSLQ